MTAFEEDSVEAATWPPRSRPSCSSRRAWPAEAADAHSDALYFSRSPLPSAPTHGPARRPRDPEPQTPGVYGFRPSALRFCARGKAERSEA